jgi:hypothetical protein
MIALNTDYEQEERRRSPQNQKSFAHAHDSLKWQPRMLLILPRKRFVILFLTYEKQLLLLQVCFGSTSH